MLGLRPLLQALAVALVLVLVRADRRIDRLPRAVWPSQYTLSLRTASDGNTFTGNVTIEVEAREETNNITLHARGLTLGSATITKEEGDPVVINEQYVETGQVLLYVGSTLQPGVRYSVHIPFSGQLNTGRQRGYYRIVTGPDQWMSGTVFEYDHAREAFPCFDEPEFKARFRVSLVHHSNHTALSNMPSMTTEKYGDEEGWVVDHFNNTPVMSPYLVAFHLIQLDKREVLTDDNRPLRVWAPTKQLRWTNNTLAVAPQALSFLRDYTDMDDPMPKLDLISIPRFQGALENWGVMSFMPSAVLYKPHWEGVLRQVLNTKVVTHELVHTWFGNLVTPRWWDGLWLSEGAATFFSSLAVNKIEPEWDQLTADTEDYLTSTFYSNALVSGKPLHHPIEWNKQLRSVSSAPYYKGFCVFRMLHYVLGGDQFQEGIRRYLSDRQYKSAEPDQFYEAMQYTYEGKSLNTLMEGWTYRQGLPLVTATRSGGKLRLTQETFSFALQPPLQSRDAEEEKDENNKWWIPVSYVTQSANSSPDAKPEFWFSEDKEVSDPGKTGEWLLLNAEAAGTYHVHYDDANIDLIKAYLKNGSLDKIPPLNRMLLILDYGMFGLTGLEEPAKVLELLEYLNREQHFAPWSVALRTFWRMEQRLRGTQAAIKLKERVKKLLTPEFNRLGMRTRKGDTVPTIRQRRQIVPQACLYNLTGCVTRSGRMFQKWADQTDPDKVNPIPPDLRLTVYCTAMKFNSMRHWKFLQERALRSRDPIIRGTMFTALGCSEQYHLLYSLIDKTDGNLTITKQDFTKLLQGLVQYNNDIGPVLDFMERSLVKMRNVLKKRLKWNQNILRDLAHQIVDPDHLAQLENLISSTKTGNEEDMLTIKSIVQQNTKWRETNKNLLIKV